MTRPLLPLLLAALLSGGCATQGGAGPPAGAEAPDWRAVATADDRRRLRDWRAAWSRALDEARGAEPAAVAAGRSLFHPDAALERPAPPPGAYRCRTIKLGSRAGTALRYIAYPWFRCRIDRQDGALRLVKLTGSQRPVGTLFPHDDRRMIFLGALQLGDEQRAPAYGSSRERDMAGAFERIGPVRWRLALPYPHFESLLDIVEFAPEE